MDDVTRFAERIAELTGRVRDLELAASSPRKRVVAGAFSGTTNATTSALTVTHNLDMPTPHTVVIQPISPNGASQTERWVSWNVTSVSANSFTIGRCVSQNGSILTSTAVTGRFVLVEH